jgi:hypothetical protein
MAVKGPRENLPFGGHIGDDGMYDGDGDVQTAPDDRKSRSKQHQLDGQEGGKPDDDGGPDELQDDTGIGELEDGLAADTAKLSAGTLSRALGLPTYRT